MRTGTLYRLINKKSVAHVSLTSGITRGWGAVEKHPSAVLRSLFVTATYKKVRPIPHNFARLASERF
jgi:hypothetical protein